MSASLVEAYSVDAWRFSGFKTNRMVDELKAIAYENKKLIPVKDLIAKSNKLYNTYNKLYLRAEVQQANNAALSAERWHSFSDDSKYMLQYRTAEDERVRDDHAILNGITLPKSDPFWSEFYPPNGWGCRCLAVEVLASQYKKTENVDTDFYRKKIFKNKNEKPFAFNPGQELKLFPPTASYYNTGLSAVENSLIEHLSFSNDYIKGNFDNETGGFWVANTKHQLNNNEKLICNNLTNLGEKIILIDETGFSKKTPDAIFNNKFTEIKLINVNNYKRIKKELHECYSKGADIGLFYSDIYTIDTIKKGITDWIKYQKNEQLEALFYNKKGIIYKYKREQ